MTPEMEQRLVATLYDRLFDLITFRQPMGREGNDGMRHYLTAETSLLHLAKNAAINPADFDNAAGPSNPDGDLTQAEAFSALVDPIPEAQTEYSPRSGATVSRAYQSIINGANSNDEPDPVRLADYEQAKAYLNTTREVRDVRGNVKTINEPSEAFQDYLTKQDNYFKALAAYRTAYAGYDLRDRRQQREWQASSLLLQSAIDTTWARYRGGDAALIEEALAVMNTSVNSAVRNALTSARQVIRDGLLASNVVGSPQWLLGYALPSIWAAADGGANYTTFNIKTSYLNEVSSAKFTEYGASGSYGGGLWRVGVSVQGSSRDEHHHTDTNDFELSAKIGVVRIMRPWFDGTIFNLSRWSMGGVERDGISDGRLGGNENSILPWIPVSFVAARDITIRTQLTDSDRTLVENSFQSSASVGWGPFSLKGNYSRSSRNESFQAEVNAAGITIPGIQIIGWVSSVIPPSPKMSGV